MSTSTKKIPIISTKTNRGGKRNCVRENEKRISLSKTKNIQNGTDAAENKGVSFYMESQKVVTSHPG